MLGIDIYKNIFCCIFLNCLYIDVLKFVLVDVKIFYCNMWVNDWYVYWIVKVCNILYCM